MYDLSSIKHAMNDLSSIKHAMYDLSSITHAMYDLSFSWYGTLTSINKNGRVDIVLWVDACSLCGMMKSLCFPRMNKLFDQS